MSVVACLLDCGVCLMRRRFLGTSSSWSCKSGEEADCVTEMYTGCADKLLQQVDHAHVGRWQNEVVGVEISKKLDKS